MNVYKLTEPPTSIEYKIKTHITETVSETEGAWFVHVAYETNEELAFRRVIYGPCESFIMAVLCEDELRSMHKAAMLSLLEHIHTILP